MSKRQTIPRKALEEVLLKSRRRCPLCYSAGDQQPQIGQIAHLVPLGHGGDNSPDNLVFLCPNHHAQMYEKGSGGISPNEIRAAREQLYEMIGRETALSTSKPIVFVVHDHADMTGLEVVKYLSSIGVRTAVLTDQPSLGRTIVERLKSDPDLGYAIVVVDPDRTHHCIDAHGKPIKMARSNVLFELGFFIGLLGSDRVLVLCREGVEMPSSLEGIPHLHMDEAGHWEVALQRELSDAGFMESD